MSNWNVGKVTDMSLMFTRASSFNRDIRRWNVENVLTMRDMFVAASSFNSDISAWNIEKVTTMRFMFFDASDFNQDLGPWYIVPTPTTSYNANDNLQVLTFLTQNTYLDTQNPAYRLVEGVGDDDNGEFRMINNVLSINAAQSGIFTIRISSTATDGFGTNNARIVNLQVADTIIRLYDDIKITPSAPTGLTTISGDTTVTLSWGEPIDSGNAAISKYQYRQRLEGEDFSDLDGALNGWQDFTSSQDGLIQTLTNLTNGVEYIFQVRAVSGVGGGAESNTSSAIPIATITDFSVFITTWRISADDLDITFPGTGEYTIDWGDGNIESASGAISHAYSTAANYDVAVSKGENQGGLTHFYLNNGADRKHLRAVRQWGSTQWETMEGAFHGATNMQITATDTPDLSEVTSMRAMFSNASSFNSDISNWNVENVADMRLMFIFASSFNSDISNWNVENVADMRSMFVFASSFNGDISNWNVGNVTDMRAMFNGASSFNSDISRWNVANVENMRSMFFAASSFSKEINNWNVENVVDMSAIFSNASSFNGDIGNWNVRKVTDMSYMFADAVSFNGNISRWNVANVRDMSSMFSRAYSFNSDISNWNVESVTDMQAMFLIASSFNSSVSNWNVSNVENMNAMFSGASIFNSSVSNWNVERVTSMEGMFDGATNFNQNLGLWYIVPTSSTSYNANDNFEVLTFLTQNTPLSEQNPVYQLAVGEGDDDNSAFRMINNVLNINTVQSGIFTIRISSTATDVFGTDNARVLVFQIADTEIRLNDDIIRTPNAPTNLIASPANGEILLSWNAPIDNDRPSVTGYKIASASATNGNVFSAFADIPGSDETTNTHTVTGLTNAVTYTFKILAVNSIGDSDESNAISAVPVNPPVANAGSSQSVILGETVVLDGTASGDTEDSNADLIFSWRQISGTPVTLSATNAAEASFITPYVAADTNLVFTLTVTDVSNLSATDVVTVTIISLAPDNFVTTWRVATDDLDITFPGTGQYTIDWGDGNIESASGAISHTYSTGRDYNIIVSKREGQSGLTRFYLNNGADKEHLRAVRQWGSVQWSSMERAFYGALNMQITAIDAPDLSRVTNMDRMFVAAHSFNADISNWNVSNVTSMHTMFHNASSFHADLSNWNVSNVTRMGYMFSGAPSFNGGVSSWNVGRVTSMAGMFQNAISFNGNISGWNVGRVADMDKMFQGARSFNSNISNWNVSNVTDMSFMFNGASSFNIDISHWNVERVTNMQAMFFVASSFNSDISNWNVESVTNMNIMFVNASDFSQNLGPWYIVPTPTTSYNANDNLQVLTFLTQNTPLSNQNPVYQLTPGEGDDDNSAFRMINNVLSINTAQSGIFTIRISSTATDGFGTNNARIVNLQVADTIVRLYDDIEITPSAPTGLTAISGDTTVTLSWNTPIDNGGAVITGYKIASATSSNVFGAFIDIPESDETTNTHTVTGLINGQTYAFKILAVNSEGDGDESNEVSATPNTPPTANAGSSQSVTLNNVVILDATGSSDSEDSNTNLSFSWRQISGAPAVTLRAASGAGPIFIAPYITQSSDLVFELTVTDTSGLRDTSLVTITLNPPPADSFITVWKISSGDLSIRFPGTGAYTINWGDGNIQEANNSITHNYSTAGNYNIVVSKGENQGGLTRFFLDDSADALYLREIRQWGSAQWESMQGAFHGAENMRITATDAPNLSQVTNMSNMFFAASSVNTNLNNWNVERVTDMSSMFNSASSFNSNVSNWNVERVTDMSSMFSNASSFNGDISNWNVESVTNMQAMFFRASSFNSSVSNWNVESVTDMSSMFFGATAFNQNLGLWYIVPIPTTSYNANDNLQVLTLSAQNAPLNEQSPAYQFVAGRGDDDNAKFTLTDNAPSIMSINTAESGVFTVRISATGSFGTDNLRVMNIQLASTTINLGADVETTPNAPSNLAATPANGEVLLTWSAPVNDGSPPITGYKIASAVSGNVFSAFADIPGSDETTNTHTVTSLTNGLTYTFKILAVNSIGDGDESNAVSAVPVNPPVANAGADAMVFAGIEVILNGSGSDVKDDLDNIPLTYGWTADNEGIILADASSATTTFIAPKVESSTDYILTLTVTNTADVSVSDTVKITVLPNTPPTANAGTNQLVTFGTEVTLDGALSSDLESDITYAWSQQSGISLALSATNSIKPTFIAPNASTTLIFSLITTDEVGLESAPSTVIITVLQPLREIYAFSATPDSINTIRVQWFLRDDGGLDPISYDVEYRLASSAEEDESYSRISYLEPSSDSTRRVIISSLISNTDYVVRMRPKSEAFTGDWLYGAASFHPFSVSELTIEGTVLTIPYSDGEVIHPSIAFIFTDGSDSYQIAPSHSGLQDEGVLYFTTPGYFIYDFSSDLDTSNSYSISVRLESIASGQSAGPVRYSNAVSYTSISTDASLSSLIIRDNNENLILLSETFVASKTYYSANVVNDVAGITLIASASDASATITADGDNIISGSASNIIDLNVGTNTISILVTAEEGTTQVYTVDINRQVIDTTAPVLTITNLVVGGVSFIINIEEANIGMDAGDALELAEISIDTSSSSDAQSLSNTTARLLQTNQDNTVVLVCLFGYEVGDSTSCRTDNPEPDTFPNALASGDIISIISNAVIDASDNGNVALSTVIPNILPTADAGADMSVVEGTLAVILDGRNSMDTDGTIISYLWMSDEASIILSNVNTATTTFDAPEVSVNTDYIFSLTVTDDVGDSASDIVKITILPNTPPVANAGADAMVFAGIEVILNGSGSDVKDDLDNIPLTYGWTADNEGIILADASSATTTFIAPKVESSTDYILTLTVTNTADVSVSDTVKITVLPNTPPTANAGTNQLVTFGTEVTLDGALSSDLESDITYAWSQQSGISLALSATNSIKPTFIAPNASTTLIFSLITTDEVGLESAPSTVIITVLQPLREIYAFSATPDSINTIRVQWFLRDDGGLDPISYDVEYRLASSAEEDESYSRISYLEPSSDSTRRVIISSLISNTDYVVRMRPKSEAFTGDWLYGAASFHPFSVSELTIEGTVLTIPYSDGEVIHPSIAFIFTDGSDSYQIAPSHSGLQDEGVLYFTTPGYFIYDFSSDLDTSNSYSISVRLESIASGQSAGPVRYSNAVSYTSISTDASLSSLIIRDNNENLILLSETFVASKTYYSANVVNDVAGITLIASASDASATITADGDNIISGSASNIIDLNVGTNTISILVTAEDGTTVMTYTIIVTRTTNFPPSISGNEAVDYAENDTSLVASYTASDGEDNTILFTLSGTDTDFFLISNSGTLTFNIAPNFENPQDIDTDNIYDFTIIATDNGSPSASSTLDVVVTVKNVDEQGSITISGIVQVSKALTVSVVTDPDGSVSDTTYQWQSSSDHTIYTDIVGASSTSYKPVVDDIDNTLRVIASYSDAEGSGKTATSTMSTEVLAEDIPDAPTIALNADTGISDTDGITMSGEVNITLASSFTIGSDIVQYSTDNGVEFTTQYSSGMIHIFILDEGIYENTDVQVRQTIDGVTSSISYLGPVTVDITPPVITLLDDATISIFLGSTYSEPGAVASDSRADGTSDDLREAIETSGTVDTLSEGQYILTYTATDTAGNTASETRTVTVRAPSTDVTLSDLVLMDNNGNKIAFTETFASSTIEYSANVANNVASITLTPTANDDNASITINGDAVNSGVAHAMSLNLGTNNIKTVVTAEDSTTIATYTIIIIREIIVPDAPTALTATPGDGQVILSWDAPIYNGGVTITSYQYRQKEDSASFTEEWLDTTSVTSHTITGLTNTITYIFQVRAVNSVGNSAASNQASTTPIAPLTFDVDIIDNQFYIVGESISFTLPQATGGSGNLVYSLENLLSSLDLSFDADTRILSGTPSTVIFAVVTYTVTDESGVSDTLPFRISVNASPIANAGINQSVNEGAAVILDGTGSTDNKPITLYGWSSSVATLTLTGADTNTAGFTAPEVEEAGLDIILTLTVTNTAGVADSATVLVRVNNVPDVDTLDVDGNGLFDRMDGMMILRYSFSIRGDGLTRGQTTTSSETVEANIQNAISNPDLDIDGSGFLSPEDFIMILRYMISSRGDALTSGQTAISPEIVEDNIKALIPTNP